jgi:hypothetical protein
MCTETEVPRCFRASSEACCSHLIHISGVYLDISPHNGSLHKPSLQCVANIFFFFFSRRTLGRLFSVPAFFCPICIADNKGDLENFNGIVPWIINEFCFKPLLQAPPFLLYLEPFNAQFPVLLSSYLCIFHSRPTQN